MHKLLEMSHRHENVQLMQPTIIIGDAELYLGDCKDVLTAIGPVDCMVTDIPYLFNTSGGGKMRKARKNMEQITDEGMNEGFDLNIIDFRLYRSVFMFCHNDQLKTVLPHLATYYRRDVTCFWEKTNPLPVANKHYQPNTEPYIHAWNKGGHPIGKLEDKKRTILTKNGQSSFDHPTVKPLEVLRKIMRNVNGDTVIDPLAGSGSTGVSALKHGKKFIGIERNPKYFNIMVGRILQAITYC